VEEMNQQLYDLALKIIEGCKFLQRNKLVISTWGNISIRLDDNKMLLTPSAIQYELMKPEDLVVIDIETGEKVMGSRVPSSEKELHRLILKNRPDVGAVVHNHSDYASAASVIKHEIPVIDEEMAQVFGGSIPCTDAYVTAGNHAARAQKAVSALGNKARGVLLCNHGIVLCGRTLEEGLNMSLIAEKAAKLYIHLLGQKINVIDEESVRSENERFLYRYGTEKDK
jgi:L-fuculose-phosphate aldolase